MNKKVIFLDIDGVLNNSKHLIGLMRLLGKNQYLSIMHEVQELPFDYRSCELINKLVKETNSEIILSSTWRLNPNHKEIIKKYADIDINNITPRLSTIRGIEIKDYLDKHKEIVNYVIIDDDSDMLPEQMNNFVKVDSEVGFGVVEYNKCLEILGGDKNKT